MIHTNTAVSHFPGPHAARCLALAELLGFVSSNTGKRPSRVAPCPFPSVVHSQLSQGHRQHHINDCRTRQPPGGIYRHGVGAGRHCGAQRCPAETGGREEEGRDYQRPRGLRPARHRLQRLRDLRGGKEQQRHGGALLRHQGQRRQRRRLARGHPLYRRSGLGGKVPDDHGRPVHERPRFLQVPATLRTPTRRCTRRRRWRSEGPPQRGGRRSGGDPPLHQLQRGGFDRLRRPDTDTTITITARCRCHHRRDLPRPERLAVREGRRAALGDAGNRRPQRWRRWQVQDVTVRPVRDSSRRGGGGEGGSAVDVGARQGGGGGAAA